MEKGNNSSAGDIHNKVVLIQELFTQLHGSDKAQATALMQQLMSQISTETLVSGSNIIPDKIDQEDAKDPMDADKNYTEESLQTVHTSKISGVNIDDKLDSETTEPPVNKIARRPGRPPGKKSSVKKHELQATLRSSNTSDIVDQKIITDLKQEEIMGDQMVLKNNCSQDILRPVKKRPYVQEVDASDDDDLDFDSSYDMAKDPDYGPFKNYSRKTKSGRLQQATNNNIESIMACRFCRSEFSDEVYLKDHVCIKTEDKSNRLETCRLCPKVFSSKTLLRSHMQEFHKCGTNRTKAVDCQHCKKRFGKQSLLSIHYETHVEDGQLICTVCGELFEEKALYNVHMNVIHNVHQSQKSMCNICGTRFHADDRYRKHMKNHDDYRCKICDSDFTSYRQLSLHSREKHGTKAHKKMSHFCQTCGEGFPRSNLLELHERIHTGEKPIRCNACNMEFRTPKGLRRHSKTAGHLKRTGQPSATKTHLCSLCGRSYFRKQTLIRHQFYHTNDRPYKCDHCNFATPELSNLKRHMALHFRSKQSFICELCGASFHTKKTLESHHTYKHIATRAFPCSQCSQSFKAKNALNRHMLIHGKVRHHKCHCGAGFNRQYNLRRHLLSVHGTDEVLPPSRRVVVLDAPPKPPVILKAKRARKHKQSLAESTLSTFAANEIYPVSLDENERVVGIQTYEIANVQQPMILKVVESETSSVMMQRNEAVRPLVQYSVRPHVHPITEIQEKVLLDKSAESQVDHVVSSMEYVGSDMAQSLRLPERLKQQMEHVSSSMELSQRSVADQFVRPQIIQSVRMPMEQLMEKSRMDQSLIESQRYIMDGTMVSPVVQFMDQTEKSMCSSLEPVQTQMEHFISHSARQPLEHVTLPVHQFMKDHGGHASGFSVEHLVRPQLEHLSHMEHISRQHADKSVRFSVVHMDQSAVEHSRLPSEQYARSHVEQSNRSHMEQLVSRTQVDHSHRLGVEQADHLMRSHMVVRSPLQQSVRLTENSVQAEVEEAQVEQTLRPAIDTQHVMVIDSLHSPNMNSHVVSTKILPHIHSATLDPLIIQQNNTQLLPSQMPQMPIVMSTHVNESSTSLIPTQVYTSQLTTNRPSSPPPPIMTHQPIILDLHTGGFHEYGLIHQQYASEVFIDQQTPLVIVPVSSISDTDLLQATGAVPGHYVKADSQLTLDALNYRVNPNYNSMSNMSMHQLHNPPS